MLRTARRGYNIGNHFYGCSNYPRCDGTLKYEKKSTKKKNEKVTKTKKKKNKKDMQNFYQNLEMPKAKGYENSANAEVDKKEYSKEQKENVKKTLEDLRLKLLDLTGRNPLISFKHRETNRNQVRLIDEIIDILYEKLNNNNILEFLFPDPRIIFSICRTFLSTKIGIDTGSPIKVIPPEAIPVTCSDSSLVAKEILLTSNKFLTVLLILTLSDPRTRQHAYFFTPRFEAASIVLPHSSNL